MNIFFNVSDSEVLWSNKLKANIKENTSVVEETHMFSDRDRVRAVPVPPPCNRCRFVSVTALCNVTIFPISVNIYRGSMFRLICSRATQGKNQL